MFVWTQKLIFFLSLFFPISAPADPQPSTNQKQNSTVGSKSCPDSLTDLEQEVLSKLELLQNLDLLEHIELVKDLPLLKGEQP